MDGILELAPGDGITSGIDAIIYPSFERPGGKDADWVELVLEGE